MADTTRIHVRDPSYVSGQYFDLVSFAYLDDQLSQSMTDIYPLSAKLAEKNKSFHGSINSPLKAYRENRQKPGTGPMSDKKKHFDCIDLNDCIDYRYSVPPRSKGRIGDDAPLLILGNGSYRRIYFGNEFPAWRTGCSFSRFARRIFKEMRKWTRFIMLWITRRDMSP